MICDYRQMRGIGCWALHGFQALGYNVICETKATAGMINVPLFLLPSWSALTQCTSANVLMYRKWASDTWSTGYTFTLQMHYG